jgi:hypothetical protein
MTDRISIGIIFLLLFAACSTRTQLSQLSYTEDLSVHRQLNTSGSTTKDDLISTYEAMAEEKVESATVTREYFDHEITTELQSWLDSLTYYNIKRGYVQGFTVQVYNGRMREEAFEVRDLLYELIEEEPEVTYVQPYFRVRVGSYLEQIQALFMKKQLEHEFPQAIVIPERIYFKK